METTHLIVGLGNPGFNYRKTRHNIGFMVIDKLKKKHTVISKKRTKLYQSFEININEKEKALLVKPMTFMNHSGLALKALIDKHNFQLNNVLVVFDDYHLPFGKIRIRPKGTSGGHNGIKSIIEHLQDDQFPRIKIGIGQNEIPDVIQFVLGKFNKTEKKKLSGIISNASEACCFTLDYGIYKTMNKFNKSYQGG